MSAGEVTKANPPANVSVLLKNRLVEEYANLAHERYAEVCERARTMRDEIFSFLAQPTAEGLDKARAAWIAARESYGRTEVFRFSGGPIDSRDGGVETMVNAWPIDEAYIDAVEGAPDSGIINHPELYPTIDRAVLAMLNQRGGETNVATGWHAIEFLLWGQDRSEAAAGRRLHLDYVEGGAPNASRRGAYLRQITDLLVMHLEKVRDAWAPNTAAENYRARFVATDPDESLKNILTGMAVLSGFEMAGERLIVAYETRDQEEEHSCFSDTTHLDFIAGQRGISDVHRGSSGSTAAVGVHDLARAVDPELATRLEHAIEAATKAVASIPPPFDRAILADDPSPERSCIRSAIEAMELQGSIISELGHRLGHRIPMEPPG